MDEKTVIMNFVLFPLGIALTWFISYKYYRKSKNISLLQPFIDYSTGILIGIEPAIKKRLLIKYDNVDIENLFELKFVIANTGNVVINNIKKPLTLKFNEEYELLNVEILRIEPQGREVRLNLSDNSEKIEFIFNLLNPGEYFEFKVLLKSNNDDSDVELFPPTFNDYKFSIEADNLPPQLAPDFLYNIDQNLNRKERNEFKLYLISGIVNLIVFGSLSINYYYLATNLFANIDYSTINFIVAIILLVVNIIGLIFISFGLLFSRKKPINNFKYIRNASTQQK